MAKRFVTAEALDDALTALSPLLRAGHVYGLSVEWEVNGSGRVAYILAPGVQDPELEVVGVAEEEDER